MSVASALWYGLITWFAFTLGENIEALLAAVSQSQRWLAGAALAIVAAALLIWWVRRRR